RLEGDAAGANRLRRPRSGEVHGAADAERHDQAATAGCEHARRGRERIWSDLLKLVFVDLDHVEAAAPPGRIGERLEKAHAVRGAAQKETVQVRVQESGESFPQPPRRLEV